MSRDLHEESRQIATARLLAIVNGSLDDGRSVVCEAISEDESALRSITSQLQHDAECGGSDDAELGRMLRTCVLDYALRVAEKRGYVAEALADLHEAVAESAREIYDDERSAA